jgi:hypothetical protein
MHYQIIVNYINFKILSIYKFKKIFLNFFSTFLTFFFELFEIPLSNENNPFQVIPPILKFPIHPKELVFGKKNNNNKAN